MQRATPKQYLPLLDRPLLLHALDRFCTHGRVRGVLVGISDQDPYWPAVHEVVARLPTFLGTSRGGATRAHTVLNGLAALAREAGPGDWVLVHDAARPCLRSSDIDGLIEAVGENDEGGLLGVPISDTVKRTDSAGRVVQTVSRDGLWRAVTPQMFRLGRLAGALEAALRQGLEITDEASAIEAAGGHPRMVAGHADNIKVTRPEDLAFAELLLRRQREAAS